MTKEIERKIRVLRMIKKLKKLFPKTKIALRYGNNWELLVAVILSAQCTDKKVNEVTEKLFRKYNKLDDYVNANPDEFQQDIKSTGFYRNKTKNILSAAKMVKKEFNGKIPKTIKEITKIPGVARKTANVVLGNAYGVHEGIAVDTHVRRLALRFNLSDYTDPNKIEKDLMNIVPKKEWFDFTHRLIDYGRNICIRRKHDCSSHPLTKIFKEASKRWY